MKPRARRVVVTGLGPITAVGTGVEALRRGLRRAESPVRTLTTFDASPFRSRMAAELPDFDPEKYLDAKQVRRVDRFVQLTLASARLAVEDAGLERDALAGTIRGVHHTDEIEVFRDIEQRITLA